MPKELTHWMVAERARNSLPEGSRLKGIIARHPDAFLGGAVLPDTLAHIFRGQFHPTARELGHRFHDCGGNSYDPLIAVEMEYPAGMPSALLCCLLGVICHIEADVVLHPYVYAATGSADIGEHYKVETAIDVHFLQAGAAPAQRRLDKFLCPSSKEVMVTAARHLFDPDGALPLTAIEQSLELHCRFQAMYDQTLWKLAVRLLGRVCGSPFSEQRQLFYPLAKSGGKDGAGSDAKWRHPESGEISSSSVDDLALEAVERIVATFRRIQEAGSLAAALTHPPGANLLTGLHGVRKKA